MPTVMLSHALYEDGMRLLREQAKVIIADNSDMDAVLTQLQKADGLILRVGKIDRGIMEKCPNLKVISRPGVGVDTVDMQAATELGIPVVIAPGTNARSVAEHAVALTYTLTKNISESLSETAGGNFGIRNKYAAIELENHTLGIIGFGNIGHLTAALFAANGMKIHTYDPYVPMEEAERCGYVPHDTLEDCLGACDVVSLHVPLTPQTRGMFGKEQLSSMKTGAFLINCARGEVVDEQALYDSLISGKLAGAAADVMQAEPMDPASLLFTCKNFIATPHMAALTRESAARTSRLTAEGTLAVLRGEHWEHVANPQVYNHPRWLK
ncbi:hydroxyacid dehydrogenase [Marasmitruncus massiliensis]|uniref:hydroxyacid dehydrogenase n=1 Tax=Marasmitruncus massiliensis TaxID=1944642 RepID=UPI000C7E4D13|nr:hydroxyacid dehydrogenase [Marasmitruncus massiliensis]